jgi:beta-lactamase superfamily II metal-dependent hydrolase
VRNILITLVLGVSLQVLSAQSTLDIYFIDVEGGQSTLVKTAAGETLLIDAGFPSTGTFDSKPANPATARDPQRILATARAAGVQRIDYVLVTHYHADHDGGLPELAQLLPMSAFIDHGDALPSVETTSAGSLDAFRAYAAVRARGRHLEPKPGDRLPLKGLDALVLSAAGRTIDTPVAGAGAQNPACTATAIPAGEPNENPRSTGIRLQFGRFVFLDVGDLSGPPLHALVCPRDLVGAVDVYLVAHHGGADAADPATFAAFRPRVSLFNGAAAKGNAAATLSAARRVPDSDVWQLHRANEAGTANAPDDHVANLDESTAHWIKVSAREDGSFTVTNGRTGQTVSYARR